MISQLLRHDISDPVGRIAVCAPASSTAGSHLAGPSRWAHTAPGCGAWSRSSPDSCGCAHTSVLQPPTYIGLQTRCFARTLSARACPQVQTIHSPGNAAHALTAPLHPAFAHIKCVSGAPPEAPTKKGLYPRGREFQEAACCCRSHTHLRDQQVWVQACSPLKLINLGVHLCVALPGYKTDKTSLARPSSAQIWLVRLKAYKRTMKQGVSADTIPHSLNRHTVLCIIKHLLRGTGAVAVVVTGKPGLG